MERYPDHETYRALYARYHDHGVKELATILKPFEGMRVIDLCGGDGRLTLELLSAGASEVLFVDQEPDMIHPFIQQIARVDVMVTNVNEALSEVVSREKSFDRIVSQQAVNYWLNAATAKLLAQALMSGGIFAFNTFNQKPSEKPRVLEYEIEGHQFVEVSWLLKEEVHHLQVRDGLPPHHTVFQWLSPEKVREILEPYFTVHEEQHGKTSLYWCEKI